MGYYIDTGGIHNKANIIAERYEAQIIPQPEHFEDIPADRALICVVDNVIFEAAAYCYSAEEFEVFSDPSDDRPKEWLVMDKAQAEGLSRFIGSYDWKKREEQAAK